MRVTLARRGRLCGTAGIGRTGQHGPGPDDVIVSLPGNPQSAGPGVAVALVRELAVERGEEGGVPAHREFQASIEAGGISRRGRAVDDEIIARRRKKRWIDRAIR